MHHRGLLGGVCGWNFFNGVVVIGVDVLGGVHAVHLAASYVACSFQKLLLGACLLGPPDDGTCVARASVCAILCTVLRRFPSS